MNQFSHIEIVVGIVASLCVVLTFVYMLISARIASKIGPARCNDHATKIEKLMLDFAVLETKKDNLKEDIGEIKALLRSAEERREKDIGKIFKLISEIQAQLGRRVTDG